MNIAVLGLGKVGLPLACHFAEIGHTVVGVDTNARLIETLRAGQNPLPWEEGVNPSARGLIFTTDLTLALDGADAVVVIVPTPQTGDQLDAALVEKAVRDVWTLNPTVPICIASTLDPRSDWLLHHPRIVYTPVMIRLGHVREGLRNASLFLLGVFGDDSMANWAREIWYPDPTWPGGLDEILSDPTTIAVAKLAINATLSSRIAWANDVVERARSFGADPAVVLKTVGLDPRIGSAYLRPGWGPAGPCFVPGTMVATPSGPVEIERIQVRDQIFGHDGIAHEVTEVHEREYDGDVLTITATGGFGFTCTPEHPLLTVPRRRDSLERFPNGHLAACLREAAEPIWTQAGAVKVGDYLATPDLFPEEREPSPLSPWPAHGEMNTPESIPITEDMARFIGLYLAEGYPGSGSICFSLHVKERDIVEDIRGIASRYFGHKIQVKRHGKNGIRVVVHSSFLQAYFPVLLGKGASNKHLPDGALSWPLKHRAQLAKGMFLGDGSWSGDRFAWVTVSKRLWLETQILLMSLGIPVCPRIIHDYRGPDGTQHRESYYIRCGNGTGADLLSRIVYGVEREPGSYRRVLRRGRATFSPIRQVKREPYSGRVYNLDVEGCHSYIVLGGVAAHNCIPRDMDVWCSAKGLGLAEVMLATHRVSNRQILDRVEAFVRGLAIGAPKVLILGATYNPGALDVTESLGLAVFQLATTKGWQPHIMDPALRYVAEVLMTDRADHRHAQEYVSDWADAIILATPWPEFRALDFGTKPVLDLTWEQK